MKYKILSKINLYAYKIDKGFLFLKLCFLGFYKYCSEIDNTNITYQNIKTKVNRSQIYKTRNNLKFK